MQLLDGVALVGGEVTLDGAFLEALTDGCATGGYLEADGVAELWQAAGVVKVAQDGIGDGIAGVDVVATVGGGDGAIFLVTGEVVPEVVIGDGILYGIHIVGRYPGEVVKAPIHEVAHICPPVVGMHSDAYEVMMVACDGDDLDKVGGTIITWFAGIDAGVPEEELITVE